MKKRSKTDTALLVTVGDVIRAVRISRGMSQEKVAFLCQSNKSAICRIETGRSNPKSVHAIIEDRILIPRAIELERNINAAHGN